MKKEILCLLPKKEIVVKIFYKILKIMIRKLSSIETNRAPAIRGKNSVYESSIIAK